MKDRCKARSITIQALGDRPLRAVQSVTDVEDIWEKIFQRYASASQKNKINVLTTMLNMKMSSNDDIADHISKMESLLMRLEAMSCSFDEHFQVALLLVSINNIRKFNPAAPAIKTMKKK